MEQENLIFSEELHRTFFLSFFSLYFTCENLSLHKSFLCPYWKHFIDSQLIIVCICFIFKFSTYLWFLRICLFLWSHISCVIWIRYVKIALTAADDATYLQWPEWHYLAVYFYVFRCSTLNNQNYYKILFPPE